MGQLLPGRAGEILSGRLISNLILYAVLGMMVLVAVRLLVQRGG
jgi:hypothetical protein